MEGDFIRKDIDISTEYNKWRENKMSGKKKLFAP